MDASEVQGAVLRVKFISPLECQIISIEGIANVSINHLAIFARKLEELSEGDFHPSVGNPIEGTVENIDKPHPNYTRVIFEGTEKTLWVQDGSTISDWISNIQVGDEVSFGLVGVDGTHLGVQIEITRDGELVFDKWSSANLEKWAIIDSVPIDIPFTVT